MTDTMKEKYINYKTSSGKAVRPSECNLCLNREVSEWAYKKKLFASDMRRECLCSKSGELIIFPDNNETILNIFSADISSSDHLIGGCKVRRAVMEGKVPGVDTEGRTIK